MPELFFRLVRIIKRLKTFIHLYAVGNLLKKFLRIRQ